MPSAITASAPPSRCLRSSPGLPLRRLGIRPDNGLLLNQLVDLAVARECPLEFGVNGVNLGDQDALRLRDRAPEVVARRGLQPFLLDRKFFNRVGGGKPPRRR